MGVKVLVDKKPFIIADLWYGIIYVHLFTFEKKNHLFTILQAVKSDQYSSSFKPCGSGQQVVYAWAKNAPELELPEDVGFRVGGEDSEIDWLVLQVSYKYLSELKIGKKGR